MKEVAGPHKCLSRAAYLKPLVWVHKKVLRPFALYFCYEIEVSYTDTYKLNNINKSILFGYFNYYTYKVNSTEINYLFR